MSFAAGLSQRVAAKRQDVSEREREGAKWLEVEDKHIEAAVELFKQRCVRAAQNLQCQTSVSFEVLTRDIPNFPTYKVKNSTYLVDSWGEVEAASWFYAKRGAAEPYSEGTPVQFAEVLEGLMPKFLGKVGALGFLTCGREPGTWKVKVSWRSPDEAQQNGGSSQNGNSSSGSATAAGALPPPPPSPPSPPSPPAGRAMHSEPEAAVARAAAPPAKRPRSYGGASPSPSRTEVPSGTEVPTSDDEARRAA